jgi:hypothetical protein
MTDPVKAEHPAQNPRGVGGEDSHASSMGHLIERHIERRVGGIRFRYFARRTAVIPTRTSPKAIELPPITHRYVARPLFRYQLPPGIEHENSNSQVPNPCQSVNIAMPFATSPTPAISARIDAPLLVAPKTGWGRIFPVEVITTNHRPQHD